MKAHLLLVCYWTSCCCMARAYGGRHGGYNRDGNDRAQLNSDSSRGRRQWGNDGGWGGNGDTGWGGRNDASNRESNNDPGWGDDQDSGWTGFGDGGGWGGDNDWDNADQGTQNHGYTPPQSTKIVPSPMSSRPVTQVKIRTVTPSTTSKTNLPVNPNPPAVATPSPSSQRRVTISASTSNSPASSEASSGDTAQTLSQTLTSDSSLSLNATASVEQGQSSLSMIATPSTTVHEALAQQEGSSESSDSIASTISSSSDILSSDEKETKTRPDWFVTSADFALGTNSGNKGISGSIWYINLLVLLPVLLYI